MRAFHLILVAIVLQGLVFAGCTRPRDAMPRPAATGSVIEAGNGPPTLPPPPGCKVGEHLCNISCTGPGTFCTVNDCLQCIPPLNDRTPTLPAEVASIDSSRSLAAR
jgi:hypothetical protein